jgi:hypothetical protein
MTTTPVITSATSPSKGALWTGRILTTLIVLFLLFDAITKVIKEAHTISASAKLGWTAQGVQNLGFILLAWLGLWLRDAGLRRIVPLRTA